MRRLAGLLLVLVALGACAGDRPPRPSGVTERWLQAISDTGRERVRDDARDRAAEDGSVDVAGPLLGAGTADHDDDDAWFADLEVGRSIRAGDGMRVPFRVTRADDDRELFGTAVLAADGHGWRVVAIDEARAGELVPSAGGPRPATATARHWLAAIALGAIATVASSLVIEVQPGAGPTGRAARTAD